METLGIEGIEIYGGSSTTTNISITDTLVTGNGILGSTYCIDNYGFPGATAVNISATRVTVTDCHWALFNEPQGVGTMTVSNSMVTGNYYGLAQFSGTFWSLGTSQVTGNTIDLNGTITAIGGH